jgi:glycosyltransferase involved in cell wall biosynthesis
MPNIYMMDLWCQTPFYDAYLCNALKREGLSCVLGATNFHLEPDYFHRLGLKNDPGLGSFASRLNIRNPKIRRTLRFLEFCGNITTLALRFLFKRPDIIHVQWVSLVDRGMSVELWFLKLAKWRGSKLVYTVHNLLPHDPNKDYRKDFDRVYALMDGLICHTRETRDRLIEEFGVDRHKIWVIPHGPLFYDYEPIEKPEAKRRLGYSPEHRVVLYQGLVRQYKGLDFLLDAWNDFHRKELNARLLIAGRGEDRDMETLKAKVETLGLQSSVRLVLRYISTEELPIYYQAADIAVYPHREITQSGALMTGIAFRKPIIATALTGFREALENYANAVCVEYGDVQGLSERLAELAGDSRERELLESHSSSQDAEAFWKAIARDTRECYGSILTTTCNARAAANYDQGIQDKPCERSRDCEVTLKE